MKSRNSVIGVCVALLAIAACSGSAWAVVVDISGTAINVDTLVGAGNSGRFIADSSINWSPSVINSDMDLNGFTITDSQGGNPHTVLGAISGTGTFIFTGPTITIGGVAANTFTGIYRPTGTMILAKTASGIDAINGSVELLNSAQIQWNGFSNQANDATVIYMGTATNGVGTDRLFLNGYSDTIGVLNLYACGLIDLGATSGGGALTVADSSAATWTAGKFIKIDNWSSSNTVSFAGLTSTQLAQVYFRNPIGYAAGAYTARFAEGTSGAIVPDALVAMPMLEFSGTVTGRTAIGFNQDSRATGTATINGGTSTANANLYNVDLNGQTVTLSGSSSLFSGVYSGNSSSTLKIGSRITLGGTAANTMAGLTQVTANHNSTQIALTLAKTAGVDAVAGPLQLDNSTANGFTVVRWTNSDQINDASVVTLNPTNATASTILRLYGKSDTIGGLTNTAVAGNAIVENDSGAADIGTLTVNPAVSTSYTFSGTLRDGDGVGTDGVLAVAKTGLGTQILSGANTYTGGTTVNGGTLTVNGALPNAVVTVTSGTLDGSGTMKFLNGNLISVGAAGIFDGSGGM